MASIDDSDPEDPGDEKPDSSGGLNLDPSAEPLPDFLDHYGGRCRGILIAHAVQLYLIVQIGSLQLAAEYFSGRFGRKFSTRPIRDIIDKIERGIIPLSREQILEAAELHRVAKGYLDNAPWAIDPKAAAKMDPVLPRRKPGRPPKSGKKGNEAAMKSAKKDAEPGSDESGSEGIEAGKPADSETDPNEKSASGGTYLSPFTSEQLEEKRRLVEGIEADLKAEEDPTAG
jgi:hypothetical protein